jgi:hypothetical protein
MEAGDDETVTAIVQHTDVLEDGLEDRSVSFDNSIGAFVTEWIREEQWTGNSVFGVRVVSHVETDPIQLTVQRDDTGDGTVDDESDWVELTATSTPVAFRRVSNGEAFYRILIRHVRPSDYVQAIDTGFIQ